MISLLLASNTADNPGIPEPIAIIIGAVIAAVSGFGAVFAQNKFQRIAERKSLAAALLGEIKAVRLTAYLQRYDDMLVYGIKCMKEGDMTVALHWRWRERYFIVFEENCGKLGLLPPDLAQQIVMLYVATKSLKENVQMLEDYHGKQWDFGDKITFVEGTLRTLRIVVSEADRVIPVLEAEARKDTYELFFETA
jgi:hypothetical protein